MPFQIVKPKRKRKSYKVSNFSNLKQRKKPVPVKTTVEFTQSKQFNDNEQPVQQFNDLNETKQTVPQLNVNEQLTPTLHQSKPSKVDIIMEQVKNFKSLRKSMDLSIYFKVEEEHARNKING